MRDQPLSGKKHLKLTNAEKRYKSPPAWHRTLTVPPHPLGIKPAGNAYTTLENIKSAAGLFSILTDELIVQILESLSDKSLLQLGATCKFFYAFCRFDDFWKNLCIGYVLFLSPAQGMLSTRIWCFSHSWSVTFAKDLVTVLALKNHVPCVLLVFHALS